MKQIISFVIRYIPRSFLQLISHFILRIMAVFYKGNKVNCTVCDHSFRKFLPYGRKARENALCPNCLALERHRLMWLFLQQKTNFFSAPLKVLHVAPELCFIDRFEKLTNLDYITGDIESPLAKVKMDIHDIPFEDNSFDVVFCNHVMEHVDDDILACKEINRVLKPDGWGIIQSPVYDIPMTLEDKSISSPAEREKLFGQRDHVRKYGNDYAKRLSKSGLVVEENNFVKELSNEFVSKHALPPKEIIYYCKKGLN
ncbi:class I SAM-dependent methyltransferase [Echinicola marina]|uniref:class I SAM-dependent methyltransferase n=1 Tax=Echinicola marina TaxID=2859768 RepID=UPI001CF6E8BB|nr:class I SAM-dependent methyltransferase [Echinicola marina]UCS93404.1 class I SAM-dependent methyltransferase [Echinicola marina]